MWPDKANFAPHVHAERPDVNANYIRMNKEIEDDFYKRKKVVQNVAEQSVEGEPDVLEQSCYRVGPFVHEENFELAQAVLLNSSIEYKKARRESKESNVFRVFLGPFASQAEAVDVRIDLRRKKIADHFIRKNSDDQYVVSLGIYTTKESADDALRLFSEVLEEVQYDSETVVLPESYWLYFSLSEENKARQQLLQVDWGERAAKMGKFGCQE